ncbi:MAG: vitamin K epoxide reductase family protein [Patescibacteria group bacterium]
MRRYFIIAILIISSLGILDASFLTYEHYSNAVPPCSNSIWVDCGKVLKSKYAMVGELPLSVLGLAFYSSMLGLSLVRLFVEKELTFKEVLWKIVERYARPRALTIEKLLFYGQAAATSSAVLMSLYLVYLQLAVIHAICLYCMFSAVLSLTMFIVTLTEYFKVQRKIVVLR